MKQLTVWTRAVILLLCFSLVSVMACGAPMPLGSVSEDFLLPDSIVPSGKVTLIVETEIPSVLSGDLSFFDDASETGNVNCDDERKILEKQNEIADDICNKTGANLISGQQYTRILNGFALEADGEDIEFIKSIEGVKNVYICEEFEFEPHLMDSVGVIDATPALTGDYTGKGQLIAVIDNEFDVTHPFFSIAPSDLKYSKEDMETVIASSGINVDPSMVYVNEKIPFAYNYADNSYNLSSSTLSHGTHVAGIAAGNTTEVSNVKGVAYNSQLALMRISSESGKMSEANFIRALEDAVKLDVCAINFSVGADYTSTYTMPLLEQCFNNLRNAGIFVSVSSGNNGKGFYGNKVLTQNIDYSTSGAVASFNSSFSVGAVNKPASGVISSAHYSAYGVGEDLILNPDISAPGSYIYSSLTGGSYGKMSGTSMAAPHVAGAYAVACEYFEEKFPELSPFERLKLIEKQFMSTAVPARSKDFVYTPRVQGAGVLNVKAALETPVILKGYDEKTKINLGSGIGNKFTLRFTAENISGSDAEYDNISMELVGDDYVTENGRNFVSGTKPLEAVHNLPEKVVISSGEIVEISADVEVDSSATASLSNVFTNGFFIDGFVHLKKSDGTLPDLSIPFMGFYGDWTKARIFDTTLYDEYGSALNDAQNGGVSLLYSTEQASPIILGGNGTGGYNSRYNAISPNGDTMQDELNFQFTPMRTFKLNNTQVITSGGSVRSNTSFGGVILNKYRTRSISFESVRNIADGNYFVRMRGTYNYPAGNPEEQVIDVPFYIDRQVPSISSLTKNDDKISINIKDDRFVSHAYTYYLDEYGSIQTKRIYIPNPEDGKEYTLEFDLSDIGAQDADMKDVYVFVHDKAGNHYVNSVAYLSGKFYVQRLSSSYENKKLTMRLGFKNFTDENYTSNMFLAFYNDQGTLIALKKAYGVRLFSDYESSYTFVVEGNLDSATRCNLFVWNDKEEAVPIDTVKDIDISDIINTNN